MINIVFKNLVYEEFEPFAINIKKYIYSSKANKNVSPTIQSNSIPQDLIEDVKKHLSENHKNLIKESFGKKEKKEALRSVIEEYIAKDDTQLGLSLDELSKGIVDAVAGLGPLEIFNENDLVTDIICNDFDEIWVTDLNEGEYLSDVKFASRKEYEEVCNKIVNASGQNWTFSKPDVDADFPNMRVNIVGFDISQDGISLGIRKFSKDIRINEETIIETKQANPLMLTLLKAVVKAQSRILISGSTGAGKTELLKYLYGYTKDTERGIMIQDTNETFLKHNYPKKNIKTWKTRQSEDGLNEINAERLTRSVLRQNPDWVLFGESRGGEAWHMYKLARTGHGIMTSLHSKGAVESVDRIADMCSEAVTMDQNLLSKGIAKTFDIGIHMEKMLDGRRRITEIVEYTGFENGEVQYNPLFLFEIDLETEMVDELGRYKYRVEGKHVQNGHISSALVRQLKRFGAYTDELAPLIKEEKLVGIS